MNDLSFQDFEAGTPLDRIAPYHFKALAALIQAEAGIKLPATKQTMLEGRLRRRVRETGHASINAYCDHVLDGAVDRAEIEQLINAVTTNKTDFFREPRHFEFMVQTALPEFLAAGERYVRAWSAACSTGAEPYTMAMLLDEFAAQNGGPDYRVLATDLDSEVLAAARKGIYARDMIRPVPERLRRKYVLEPRDRGRGEVRIAPELRRRVSFGRLNLMDSRYVVGEPLDLIFCRNVLIYFDKPTQAAVVSRLCENLRPGGYLFLGHSETITGFQDVLAPVAGTVFRRL